MNRRELLKSISLFTGAAMLLPKTILTKSEAKKLHLVGIGDGGCKMVLHLINKVELVDYTLINSNFKGDYLPINQWVVYELPVDAYNGRNINMATLQSLNGLPQNVIDVFADSSKHYVLFTGLGGFTGSYLSKAIASHLQAKNIAYYSIISLPFTHEGMVKRKHAELFKKCFSSSSNTVFVDYDSIREKHGNFKLKDAFTIADDYTLQAYQQLNVCS